MKKDRLNTLIAALFFAAAFIVLAIILVASFKAVKNLAAGYTALRNADLSKTVTGTLMYDDGFYGQILHGIETDPADPAAAETMNNFLSSSMRAIDTRIFSAGLIYTMVISVLSSFLIYLRCRENTIKHLFYTAASVIISYIIFILAVFAFHTLQGVPFCFPDGHGFFLILTGLLSLTAGGSFLAVLYRKIPWKKTAAILALPLAFGLFLLNMNMEAGLYNSKELESFDYVIEAEPQIIDENYTGEAYYDDQKNVMIVEGKEYPPETIDNPDHFRGISRAGAYVFEALDPWSGSFAFMAEDILKGDDMLEKPLPFAAGACYIIKAAAWMILSLILKEKTDFKKETL